MYYTCIIFIGMNSKAIGSARDIDPRESCRRELRLRQLVSRVLFCDYIPIGPSDAGLSKERDDRGGFLIMRGRARAAGVNTKRKNNIGRLSLNSPASQRVSMKRKGRTVCLLARSLLLKLRLLSLKKETADPASLCDSIVVFKRSGRTVVFLDKNNTRDERVRRNDTITTRDELSIQACLSLNVA